MRKKKILRKRLLSRPEIEILKFLWAWKLSNTLALKSWISPQNSFWKFYQRLRNLHNEGYIEVIQVTSLSIDVWSLTKKGFSFLFDHSQELEQNRYQPQSLIHDFWGTAFHLGDFIHGLPSNVQLLSEQEVNARKFEFLPDWIPQSKEHIPDGYTRINNGQNFSILAFEIETSTKTVQRYEEMIRFLDKYSEINLVFWLCESDKLIAKITQQIVSGERRNCMKHHFVRLSDFQNLGWQSPILWGEKANMSFRQAMGQLGVNTSVNTGLTPGQLQAIDVFCSNVKSPKGLKI